MPPSVGQRKGQGIGGKNVAGLQQPEQVGATGRAGIDRKKFEEQAATVAESARAKPAGRKVLTV